MTPRAYMPIGLCDCHACTCEGCWGCAPWDFDPDWEANQRRKEIAR